jgi:hypothetical protein
MKRLVIGLAMLVAACGADGEPIQPVASLGLAVGSNGVHASAGIGATKGPVSVFVGF